jgi:hypothetical protein
MAALAERTGWQIEGMCANGRQNAWQAALSTQIADSERPIIGRVESPEAYRSSDRALPRLTGAALKFTS